jgi:hypothetical protein
VSRTGRPWDKVRPELLNGIDQRNTVQQHILRHVDDYVLEQVRLSISKYSIANNRPNESDVICNKLHIWKLKKNRSIAQLHWAYSVVAILRSVNSATITTQLTDD